MRRRIYAVLSITVRRSKGYEHAGQAPGMRIPVVLQELPVAAEQHAAYEECNSL